MRVAFGKILYIESETFSPIKGEVDEFKQNGLYFGEDIFKNVQGIGDIGAFIDIAKKIDGVELLPIMYATAYASGKISNKLLDFFVKKLIFGLKKIMPIDGLFLSMMGAAVSDKIDDVEGYLLKIIRDIVGPKIPIVLTLDHHANITKQMIELADLMVGYETQPHKPYETGEKAARLFFSLLKNEFIPAVSWQKIPMIVSLHERLDTSEGEPMKEWFDLARELEKKPDVISISNFPTQPWLDVKEAGWSTIVYTDNKSKIAQKLTEELANKAWKLRKKLMVSERLSPEEAIKQASKAEEGSTIISDPADTVWGGTPGDSTCLLKEMLNQKITCTAFIPLYDPEVVAEVSKAEIRSNITIKVGGKWGSDFYNPIKVRGEIIGISEGFEIDPRKINKSESGPFGLIVQGKTVVLKVGSIYLLISDKRLPAGIHPDIYRHFGLEPAEAKIIVMKTGSNFQFYKSIIKNLIRVDCPGFAQADLKKFDWKKIPRPIFPLDELENWEPKVY